MKHSENCLKLQEALRKWATVYPNYCHRCGGYGSIRYDATRNDPDGSDPCSNCLEIGKCPRCGAGSLESVDHKGCDYGKCRFCGWNEWDIIEAQGNWKEMVAPWDGECECWIDEEQDKYWQRSVELEEVEIEQLEQIEPYFNLYVTAQEHNSDPIRQEDGKWYFYDESWSIRFGPYEYESVAKVMLDGYILRELDPTRYYWADTDFTLFQLPYVAACPPYYMGDMNNWTWYRDRIGRINCVPEWDTTGGY